MNEENSEEVPFGVGFEERKSDNAGDDSSAETDTYRKDTEDGDA